MHDEVPVDLSPNGWFTAPLDGEACGAAAGSPGEALRYARPGARSSVVRAADS
jgi:hypothetical protein